MVARAERNSFHWWGREAVRDKVTVLIPAVAGWDRACLEGGSGLVG